MAKPKFIIHLDINGTIMPADPIKSKHVESMLNIHLSKQAFVRRSTEPDGELGDIVWWDGSPFHKGDKPPLLPQFRYTCHIEEHYKEGLPSHAHQKYPLKESVSLEDFNAAWNGGPCDTFTAKHLPGNIYEADLLNLLDNLEWKHPEAPQEVIEALTLPVVNGRRMSLFVPAFLYLLRYLWEHREEREYVLVIRTFGSDVPRLIPAFNLIAKGLHPDLPQAGTIREPHAFGTLTRKRQEFSLHLQSTTEPETRSSISKNEEILNYFESLPSGSVVMVCDDYDTWRMHNFSPLYGKPIFVDLDRTSRVRHFLFDDNVNMDPTDSIAAVWLRSASGTHYQFKPLPLSSREGKAMIGTVLLQASLYVSILNETAFVAELQRADKRYETLRTRLGSSFE